MLSLGPHASFIVATYAVTFIGIAALILATVGDDLKQRRRLSELERQGIKRRSDPKTTVAKKPAPKTRTRAAKPSAAKKPPASKAATGKPAPERPRARKTPA